jgi:hypothetical protein
MAIKYINIIQSEALNFFSQIGIFGSKTNHLATLPPKLLPIDKIPLSRVSKTHIGPKMIFPLAASAAAIPSFVVL